ncbi:hypothetical protein Tco_0709988 [Tanacetum coccineum]
MKLTTGRLIDGSSCDRIDIVIKYLDLEPKIDAMMRDFLDPSQWKELSKEMSSVGMDPQTEVCGMSILFAPTRWCWIVHFEEFNGVLVAFVARFGVISKNTDRIRKSYGLRGLPSLVLLLVTTCDDLCKYFLGHEWITRTHRLFNIPLRQRHKVRFESLHESFPSRWEYVGFHLIDVSIRGWQRLPYGIESLIIIRGWQRLPSG